jgi:hypothetical protein
MPANIAINFNTSSSESTASLVDASFASQDSMALAKNFAGGNGDHQIDLIYEKRGSAAASPEAVDLSMVSDQNGNLAAFATLKGLIICNKGAANALDVSGSYFGTTAAIAIPAGGALVLLLPIGVDITADSNDIISIGSALGTEYEMRLIGVNVDEAE